MKTHNPKHLRLLDIVPDKLYVKKFSTNTCGFDLISFQCSETHGAHRGLVRLFFGFDETTEIFPNDVLACNAGYLSVKVTDQRGSAYSLRVRKDSNSDVLVLDSNNVFPNPNLDNIRSDIECMIKARERDIAELQAMYNLLKQA